MTLNDLKLKTLKLVTPYISHLCLILCLLTLVVTIFNIDGQGFLPYDDCLRHCAKAVSGKPWNEILVIRPDYHDHNAGWHHILETIHHTTGAEVPELISFSIIFLFLCATLPMLLRSEYPEAWMAALLLLGLLYFNNFYRLFYGRPYIFAMGGTLLILDMWTRSKLWNVGCGTWNAEDRNQTPENSEQRADDGNQIPTAKKHSTSHFTRLTILLSATTIIFALMTYIHGSFYTYIIPVGAFLLAGQWKKFLWLLPCLIIGILLGMSLTGDLPGFWHSQILHLKMITSHEVEPRFLVSEFHPNPAFSGFILLIILFLSIRYLHQKSLQPLWKDPVFILLIGMGILGFRNARFWLDFGIPAMLLWSYREIAALFKTYTQNRPIYYRLLLTGGLCVAFFLMLSADVGNRWNNNHPGMKRIFPKAEDPDLQGWFPEEGGIFYNRDMTFFYNTFAANPHANWRYTLGFEPNVMPDDNLATYRAIQKEDKWKSFDPWLNKMTPKDRMVLHGAKPEIETLEWKEVFPGMWWGRIPAPEEETSTNAPQKKNESSQ